MDWTTFIGVLGGIIGLIGGISSIFSAAASLKSANSAKNALDIQRRSVDFEKLVNISVIPLLPKNLMAYTLFNSSNYKLQINKVDFRAHLIVFRGEEEYPKSEYIEEIFSDKKGFELNPKGYKEFPIRLDNMKKYFMRAFGDALEEGIRGGLTMVFVCRNDLDIPFISVEDFMFKIVEGSIYLMHPSTDRLIST